MADARHEHTLAHLRLASGNGGVVSEADAAARVESAPAQGVHQRKRVERSPFRAAHIVPA